MHGPAAGRCSARSSWPASSCRLPKRSMASTCATRAPSSSRARGSSSAHEAAAVESDRRRRRAGRRRPACGDRREDVAAVEGRRDRLRRCGERATSTASTAPPKRSQARLSSPLSGPDEHAVLLRGADRDARRSAPTSGSTTARCTPGGHEWQRPRSISAPARTSWRRDAVGEVDDRWPAGSGSRSPRGRRPTNSSSLPVVRQEVMAGPASEPSMRRSVRAGARVDQAVDVVALGFDVRPRGRRRGRPRW